MNTSPSSQSNYSLDTLSQLGNEIYITQLKDKLEPTHNRDYVVIEVQSKKYFVDSDLKKALLKAEKKFPDKLFHIVKVGDLQTLSPTHSYAGLF